MQVGQSQTRGSSSLVLWKFSKRGGFGEWDFDREIVKISKIFRLIYANLYFVAGSLFESCRVSKFPLFFFFFLFYNHNVLRYFINSLARKITHYSRLIYSSKGAGFFSFRSLLFLDETKFHD